MFTVRQIAERFVLACEFLPGVWTSRVIVGPDFGYLSGARPVLDAFWLAQKRSAEREASAWLPQYPFAPVALRLAS